MVKYNRRKKETLKRLNEQITKQDGMDHKPRSDTNNYVYVSALSVFVLAIGGCPLQSKFKKPEQSSINITLPPAVKNSTEPKRDIFEML